MTLVVAIQVQDGVVLASDSAMTHRGHIYYNAEKIVRLARGRAVGVAVCGDGAIGATSMSNLIADFDAKGPRTYGHGSQKPAVSLRRLVDDLGHYIEDAARIAEAPVTSTLILSGYADGDDLPQTWALKFRSGLLEDASVIWDRNDFGVNWDGQGACISRLLMDMASPEQPVTPASESRSFKQMDMSEQTHMDSPILITPGMPILDAVEIARFLIGTSIQFESYRVDQSSRAIGGPVDIAVVTPLKGFKWIQRKRPQSGRRTPRQF